MTAAAPLAARRLRRPGWLGAAGLAVVLAWLVGYPLLITAGEAVGVAGLGAGGFTLARFAEFAGRPDEWMALWRTVWISLATVALAAAIGVPLGFVFERAEFPGRRVLGALWRCRWRCRRWSG
jgi:iron(III) transport system permease protein